MSHRRAFVDIVSHRNTRTETFSRQDSNDPPSLAAARADRAAALTAEVDARNQEIEARLARLGSWLVDNLDSPPLTIEQMLRPPVDDKPDLGDLAVGATPPIRPPLFKRFGKAESDYRRALIAYERREQQRQLLLHDALETHRLKLSRFEQARLQHNSALPTLQELYVDGQPSATAEWLQCCLESEASLDNARPRVMTAYVAESRQLVVEVDVPSIDIVPSVVSHRLVKSSGAIVATKRPVSAVRATYLNALAQVVLLALHRVFIADVARHVDTVCLSAYVDGVDLTTGLSIHPCLATVTVTRERFDAINLARVNPVACLNSLNATVSRNPAELQPVRPSMQLNLSDRRFVAEEDVLSMLDARPNLLELSPSEFESLITNLFAQMGLETRLTRASRDGGVDVVAFDQRPVVGGKVVIQAKRYKDTVGVSAVRDLYGTVLNEGAGKGILVTTSGYGQAAFDFAAGKPLELLSGSHLLSLLAEHAGVEAKIERVDEVMVD